jgi:hypothetical protein
VQMLSQCVPDQSGASLLRLARREIHRLQQVPIDDNLNSFDCGNQSSLYLIMNNAQEHE